MWGRTLRTCFAAEVVRLGPIVVLWSIMAELGVYITLASRWGLQTRGRLTMQFAEFPAAPPNFLLAQVLLQY